VFILEVAIMSNHIWTEKQIQAAVQLCREHHCSGNNKFAPSILPNPIPGQGRKVVKQIDRNKLLFAALFLIFKDCENLGLFITGSISKSNFCIHLARDGSLFKHLDSSLLCDSFLLRLLSPCLENTLGPEQLEIYTTNVYMWCEIFNLFYIYDRNGRITDKDLFADWEEKDRKELILMKAGEFISLYTILRKGWELTDLSDSGLFANYNDLFLAIIDGTAKAFFSLELNPSDAAGSPSKKFQIIQQIEGYFDGDDRGNYSLAQRNKAIEKWDPYWEDALKRTGGQAIFACFQLDPVLIECCDPEMVSAVKDWRASRKKFNILCKRLINRQRNKK
jgi:hypothetical protein